MWCVCVWQPLVVSQETDRDNMCPVVFPRGLFLPQHCSLYTCCHWAPSFFKYGVSLNLYAEDTQLYLPFKHNDSSSIDVLLACIKEANYGLHKIFWP